MLFAVEFGPVSCRTQVLVHGRNRTLSFRSDAGETPQNIYVTGPWLLCRPSGHTSGTAASIICSASS